MIRVLNIIGRLDYGGMETSVMNYYRHIDRAKIQYDFLFTTDEEPDCKKYSFEDEAVSMGARIFFRPTRAKHPIRNVRALFKILKENPEIRIVHIYHPQPVKPALDAMWAMIKGIKVRIAYGANETRSRFPITQRAFRPLLRAAATHWLAASTEAGISMFGEKAKDKLVLVPRARDLQVYKYCPEKRRSVRQEMGLDGSYAVLNVGRLTPQKNQLFLLGAFADAKRLSKAQPNRQKKQPDMVLLIAGSGQLYAKLKSKAAELGVEDCVRLLGRRDDVPGLLQAADLFVLPSLHEGLPGAAVEAQAAGLPCLLSDTITKESKITEAVEFLPIYSGFKQWVERMLAYQDFERRDTSEELRRAGYDIKEAAKWLEGLYLEALGNRI